jgi:hypothetical protein
MIIEHTQTSIMVDMMTIVSTATATATATATMTDVVTSVVVSTVVQPTTITSVWVSTDVIDNVRHTDSIAKISI